MILSSDRIHNTDVDTLVFKDIPVHKQEISHKPVGLWYSFGKQWLDWCEYEMPDWIKKNFFKLNITECNILKITNAKELREFDREYKILLYGRFDSINWINVAKKYDGIEIYNIEEDYKYIYEEIRNKWYNTWDIGSGCIWRNCNVVATKVELDESSKSSVDEYEYVHDEEGMGESKEDGYKKKSIRKSKRRKSTKKSKRRKSTKKSKRRKSTRTSKRKKSTRKKKNIF